MIGEAAVCWFSFCTLVFWLRAWCLIGDLKLELDPVDWIKSNVMSLFKFILFSWLDQAQALNPSIKIQVGTICMAANSNFANHSWNITQVKLMKPQVWTKTNDDFIFRSMISMDLSAKFMGDLWSQWIPRQNLRSGSMISVDLSTKCRGLIYDPIGSQIQILGIGSRDPFLGSVHMSGSWCFLWESLPKLRHAAVKLPIVSGVRDHRCSLNPMRRGIIHATFSSGYNLEKYQ